MGRRRQATAPPSPLADALARVGDRWTLLLIRDLLLGKTRYVEFQASPEKIPTNILADRLRLLECAGVIERLPGEAVAKHFRYRLTRKGADLLPVVQALTRWGFEHIPGRWKPPAWFLKAKPSDFYPEK
jgi:DNA-binding HxlR family transcriptional regulator